MTTIENKQAEPVAQPYAYVYEFDSGMFGIHRSFSSNERNGSKPSRVVPVYTHPAPSVAQPPAEVVRELVEAYDSTRMALQMFSSTFDKCGFVPSEATKNLVDRALQNIESAITKAKEHGL